MFHANDVTWLGFYKQSNAEDGPKKKKDGGEPGESPEASGEENVDESDGDEDEEGKKHADKLKVGLSEEDQKKGMSVKYIHLHATSEAKCKPDLLKYERAKRL